MEDEKPREAHTLKPGTQRLYQKEFQAAFEDWSGKEITTITRTMVENRHAQISERAKARANLAMRILRALFNFAIGKYEDAEGQPVVRDNPVQRLSAVRAWNRVDRRRTLIRPHQLPAWFDAVEALRENPSGKARTTADWLEFLILTGCRRAESLSLSWADVDLNARFFRLPDTKNHQVHELPLSDRLHELLLTRYPGPGATGPVFEGSRPEQPLIEPRRWIDRVAEQSGVPFTAHDLRRTFATTAESLDLTAYAIKRLLNHTSGANGDVTSGYLIIDVERLRVPMQRITDAILTAAGRRGPKSDVIPIQARLDHAGHSAS